MKYPPTFKNIVCELAKITKEYMKTGVFVFERDRDFGLWRKRILLHPTCVRKFARACARDMGVPFLWAETGVYDTGQRNNSFFALVSIPNRKYLAPVLSALRLVASEPPVGRHLLALRHWRFGDNWPPCWLQHGPSVVTVFFRKDEGKMLFDNWLGQCRTNKAFRKALRFTQ